MKPMLFRLLIAVFVWTASEFLVAGPPVRLAGAWLVTSTSVDDDSNVVRGNLLLLLQQGRLILAESFPNNDSQPYANAIHTTAKMVGDTIDGTKFTAILQLPAVEPSCWGLGRDEPVTSVEFLVCQKDDGDRLAMHVNELRLTARRISAVDASKAIRALLQDPDLECNDSVRAMLSAYGSELPKTKIKESVESLR